MTHTDAPRVTVVMPVKNAARFAGAAVRSALSQRARNFELLVVDDHSSDGSLAVVQAIDDPRIQAIPATEHGVAAARNAAVCRARGEFVAFLDADDLWLEEHLQLHLNRLEQCPDLDFTFSAVRWIDESGAPIGRPVTRHAGRFSYEDLLLEYRPVTASSWVVRRSALSAAGQFDPALAAGSDHDLCLRVALLRPLNVEGLAPALVHYRRRTGQLTADRARKMAAWRQLVEKHTALTARATPPLLRRSTANLYRALAALAFEDTDYAEARAHFSSALRLEGLALFDDRRTWVTAAALAASLLPAALRRPVLRLGRRLMGGA